MEAETKSPFFAATCEHSLSVFSYLTNIIEVFIMFVDVRCSCMILKLTFGQEFDAEVWSGF